jgi:hypothetical protein
MESSSYTEDQYDNDGSLSEESSRHKKRSRKPKGKRSEEHIADLSVSSGSSSVYDESNQHQAVSSRPGKAATKVRKGLEQSSYVSNDSLSASNTSSKSKNIIELGGNYDGADLQAMRAARASRAALDIGRLQITSSTPPGLFNVSRINKIASVESIWSANIDDQKLLSSSLFGITHDAGDELFYNIGLDVIRKVSKLSKLAGMSDAFSPPNHESGFMSLNWDLYVPYKNIWTFASLTAVFDPKWIQVGGADCVSFAVSQTILRRGVGPDLYINAPTQRTQALRRKRADSDESFGSSASIQDFLSANAGLKSPDGSKMSYIGGELDDIETVSLKSDSHPSISEDDEHTDLDMDTDDEGDEESVSTVMTRPISIDPNDEFLGNGGLSWNDSQLVGSLVDDAMQCALLKCDAVVRASQRVHRMNNRRASSAMHAIGGVSSPTARRTSIMRRPSAYRSNTIDASTIQASRSLNGELRPITTTDSTSSNPNDSSGTLLVPQTEEPGSDSEEELIKVPNFHVEEEFVSKEVEDSVMTFLLWQNRLADATEFLFCMGTHALSVESKKEAFDYLLQRVESAQEILATRATSKKNIRVSKLKSKAMSFMMSKRRSSLPATDEKPGRRPSQDVIPQAPSYIMQNRAAVNKKMKPIRRASVAITIAKKLEDISHSVNLREIQQRILKAELQRQEEEAISKKRREEEERAAFLRIKPTDPLKDPALLIEVLSRTNQAMPLSYTAQLGSHRGSSITWEDGLEDGQLGGAPAKERPNKTPKAKSGGRHRNPVHFLDDPSLDSFDAFNKSIGEYRSCGYPSGSREYFEVWSQKIKTSLDRFSTVGQLSRSMEMLRKSVERETGYAMSRAEALCALAEAKGSTSEALGVLKDTSFLEEDTSVSRSVPTDDIASILENACKLGMAAFFNGGARGEKRRDGKRQGLTQTEALESKGLSRKEKDAAVFDVFKELVHKILDSQLSPDTIVQIAKVQGESDLSAASVFMPQVMAAMSAPAGLLGNGSGINSPLGSPGNTSRQSGFLPSIEVGHRTPLAQNHVSTGGDSRVSFAVESPSQRSTPVRNMGARTAGASFGLATSSSLSELDAPRMASQRSPPRVFAGGSVGNLSVRTSGFDDTAAHAHLSEWGNSGAFGSMALNSHSIESQIGSNHSPTHSSNQKAVSDALRIERTIRRIMRSSLDDKEQSPEKVFSEKDMYKTKRGAKRGME